MSLPFSNGGSFERPGDITLKNYRVFAFLPYLSRWGRMTVYSVSNGSDILGGSFSREM